MKSLHLFLLFVFSCASGGSAYAENSTGLEAALRATLSLHPLVSSKREQVSAKVYTGDIARAQRYPTLSIQASALDNGTRPVTLRARQPLWAFGRIDSGIDYADTDVLVEEADLLRVKRQLMDQTAVAYARTQGAMQRLRVAVGNVAELDKFYQQIQRREHGQVASVADVTLARARLLQARAQQERYDSELALAKTELQALTQMPVQFDQIVPDGLTRLPSVTEMEVLVREHSADLCLKKRQFALAQADLEREKASIMPTLSMQMDSILNQPTDDNSSRIGVILEGSLDGSGFSASGRRAAAGARMQAHMEELNSTRNELDRTVKSLYISRELQQQLAGSQGQSVTELMEIFASYQRQYEAGLKSWLDVLNIQRELTEQRLQQVQAENDWLIYTLKLAALSGGLDALSGEKKE